jgi:Fe-S cluster assembly protein SufD
MTATLISLTENRFLKSVRNVLHDKTAPAQEAGWAQFRLDALLAAERLGLPTRKDETYRFTDLKPLLEPSEPWQTATALVTASQPCSSMAAAYTFFAPAQNAMRLVFLNGQFSEALSNTFLSGHLKAKLPLGLNLTLFSQLEHLDETHRQTLYSLLQQRLANTEDGLEAAMMALSGEGLYLQLDAGVALTTPIELLFIQQNTETPIAAPFQLVINLGDNSSLQLGIQGVGQASTEAAYTYVLQSTHLAANAQMQQTQFWQPATQGLSLSQNKVTLAKQAQYHLVQLATGGVFQRHDVQVALQGEGAHAGLHGLALLAGTSALHQHVDVLHQAPEATSQQHYKAIVDDAAKAEFAGHIGVALHAQKTDAKQLCRNLLLSRKAKAFARPWLNIDADDVKCSHGTTVGQLSADELFYLASRGIPESVARCMLTYGFAADVLRAEVDAHAHAYLVRRALEALGLSDNPSFCFTTCTKH